MWWETYLGDCLEKMKEIPDSSVDMILTDPPYGMTIQKWDQCLDMNVIWPEIWRVCKPNAAVLLFGIQPFTTKMISSNLKDYRYNFVWIKEKGTNFVNSNKMPMKKSEDVMVFYKKLPYYDSKGTPFEKPFTKKQNNNPSRVDGFNANGFSKTYTHRKKTNVLEFCRAHSKKTVHPTQKPVELLKYLIQTYTQEGETVLDFTMGSGSTGVACVQSKRNFIGIELDQKYFNIAKERITNERT